MLKRYAIFALVILCAVGAGVIIFSWESRPDFDRLRPPAAPPVPNKAWAASPELDAEANADFRVEGGRSDRMALAGKASDAEWPQFNGARRDNKSSQTGLLRRWPKEGPELAWMARGVGSGYSTVAVDRGVIYTMGNKGRNEAVIALDAGTGERIWSTPFAWASHLPAGDGPRSTPTVDGDAVYALGGNGSLVCLDARGGKIRWQKNIHEEFDGARPGWGTCESVLIDQRRLICTPGGRKATLAALEPQSGNVIWTAIVPGKDGAGYASAAVAVVGGVRQYVQLTAKGTVGVRAEDGKFLWREDSAANGTANCSSPLVDGDLVFSASGYGTGGALVRLAAGDSTIKAQRVYKTQNMKNHHGDMVIVDGLLFGSNDPGILTCLELAAGQIKWQSRAAGKGSITAADGCIYLRTEAGAMILVEATGAGYRELGRFEQPKRSTASAWPHPVVAEGRLFLRDQDLLFCYDVTAR